MGRKGISEEKQAELVKDYTDQNSDCYHSTNKTAVKHRICAQTANKYLIENGVKIIGRSRTPQVDREKPKERTYFIGKSFSRKKPEKPRHDTLPKPGESKVKIKPNSNAVTKLTIDRIICEYTYIDGPYYMKSDALAKKHYLEPQMLTDILIHEGVTDKYGRLTEGQGHHQAPPGESKKEVKPDKRVTPDEFYDKVFNNVKSELRKIFPKGTVITVSFDMEL